MSIDERRLSEFELDVDELDIVAGGKISRPLYERIKRAVEEKWPPKDTENSVKRKRALLILERYNNLPFDLRDHMVRAVFEDKYFGLDF